MKDRLPKIWIGVAVIVLNTSFVLVGSSAGSQAFQKLNRFFSNESIQKVESAQSIRGEFNLVKQN